MSTSLWRPFQMAFAILVSALSLGCDPSGKAYEDPRLARLKPGESTEQDVRQLFGNPEMVRDLPGGKGLVYPLGPEGPHTLLITIGADGKYQGRENLLTRANFAKIAPGMTQAQVQVVLGRPGSTQSYKLKQQMAWEWRFLDGPETRVFVVMFDAAGTVVSSAVEEDPRKNAGS
jgi:outer membrane protein assembly factor BamE (lipoprotein component of BamABCDE complex)